MQTWRVSNKDLLKFQVTIQVRHSENQKIQVAVTSHCTGFISGRGGEVSKVRSSPVIKWSQWL